MATNRCSRYTRVTRSVSANYTVLEKMSRQENENEKGALL